MAVSHDDVVSDVGVEGSVVVFGRGVDADPSGVVHDVVVGNGGQACVLNEHVDHSRWRVVEDLEME